MNQIITPKSINFKELVQNANITLSLNIETKLINILNEEFTEEEQKWYRAILYIDMNYHPTNDYPINLEDVFKMIGFANKENAKRTLKNNFSKDEDYKIIILRMEGQIQAGYNKEDVLLNVNTFKNLCMTAKTKKGKEIRRYYLKLENMYCQLIKEEIEKQNKIFLEIYEDNKRKVEMTLKNKIIDLENENIELKKKLSNDEYINHLKNKIETLEKTINDINEQKSSDENETIETIENEDTINDRIFKKRKVDKIDPTTLNIIETYECINVILVKNKEEKYSYNGIYKSIKKNNVYKNYRWNYHGEEIKPTNKITRESSKVERVFQLDKNKNFVKSFKTKSELCKILHIGIVKLNKYINEGKVFNDFYYVNESSYDGEIIDDEDNYVIHNSKPIRETNVETNETVIYISMQELYEKRGISRQTLRNCIKNNKICDKFKWEYVNNDHNKNNNKKVKEINIENNTFTEYHSMKEVYTKLNITLEKLRELILHKKVINNCRYEFC